GLRADRTARPGPPARRAGGERRTDLRGGAVGGPGGAGRCPPGPPRRHPAPSRGAGLRRAGSGGPCRGSGPAARSSPGGAWGARLPFDLERGPLARALLLRLPRGAWLGFVLHRLACDHRSLSLLAGELTRRYLAVRRDEDQPAVGAVDPQGPTPEPAPVSRTE